MSARRMIACALVCASAAALPAHAQDRITLVARYGALRPTAHSELYDLLDRALTPGSSALRPQVVGGELRVRVAKGFAAVVGAESGSDRVSSSSQTRPTSGGDVRQETALTLTGVPYAGVQWTARRWDRLSLHVGAGGGLARYRVHQWGDFVDASRGVAYADDYTSSGRGAIGYANIGAAVPVRSWLAIEADVRRQFGTAPMRGDYATFDRLDLGGTRIALGAALALHP